MMVRKPLVLILFTVGILTVLGCGQKSLIVLVPDPDGTVGSVEVSNPAGSVILDEPYQSSSATGTTAPPAKPVAVDQDEVAKTFSEALDIQPKPPVHFILYFESNSTQLRPESEQLLPDILAAIQDSNLKHVSIIGHSDTKGNKEYNLVLSTQRALAVKKQLVSMGINVDTIDTTSHGEENPLIKTADNVSNPKNRRVEVVVR